MGIYLKNDEPVTRKQHYVQRKYLSLWTDDLTTEGTANFEIDGKEQQNINIKVILFQKNFYEIPILNNREIATCEQIMCSIPSLIPNNVFSYVKNLKITKALYDAGDKELRTNLKLMLIQLGEDFQKCAENMMSESIREKILNCDDSFLNDQTDRQSFFNYLFMQYMRTPKILRQINKNTEEIFGNKTNATVSGKKIWSAIHNALASAAANYMTNQNIRIKFLISKKEELITCDCPVVRLSLAKDSTDRFYYPFSPKIGMVIGNNEENSTKILDANEVLFYNDLIRNNAERIVVFKYKKIV